MIPHPFHLFSLRIFHSSADLEREEDIQGTASLSPGQQTVLNTLATPVKALMNTPQIAETIRKGVDTFMEVAPPLMKALDEVAKIHPFISGASPCFFFPGKALDA